MLDVFVSQAIFQTIVHLKQNVKKVVATMVFVKIQQSAPVSMVGQV
jgi:hypothetical protein